MSVLKPKQITGNAKKNLLEVNQQGVVTFVRIIWLISWLIRNKYDGVQLCEMLNPTAPEIGVTFMILKTAQLSLCRITEK